MAPRPPKQTASQARDARAKKILLLLVPILVIAVAIQAPRLLKSSSEEQAAAPTDTAASVDGEGGTESVVPETAAPSDTSVPPTTGVDAGAGATDPAAEQLAATVVAPTEGLDNTDPPPEASEGQLVVFTRFVATDPFVQLVDDTTEDVEEDGTTGDTSTTATDTSSTSSSGGTTSTVSSGTTTGTGTGTDTGGSSTTTVEVKIKVNNKLVVVNVGDTFPASDPAFELVAVEGDVAKIGLAGGSFSSGVETLDLREGDSVTLISQPDGARFTLELVSIG